MSNVERKLASIRTITEIRPIPEADAIECAYVGGWPVVVKKEEFSVGDLAVFIEPDSWAPHELAPFLSKGREPREYNGVKGERLKTQKIRKQLSQGLLLPITDTLQREFSHNFFNFEGARELQEGDDLTEMLGIQKWEAPIPTHLAGQIRGNFPSFVPRTDSERIQNLVSEVFEERKGESYEATIKLDGSSCTVYVKDADIGVCSRRLDLKETPDNSFWRAARDQKIIEALLTYCEREECNIALQMELMGNKIQGNQEKIDGLRLFLFDIYDIDRQSYVKPLERLNILDYLQGAGADLDHIPVLEPSICVTERFATVEELLAYADGPSLNPQVRREGLVFKSHDSTFSFKAISNEWLLKKKD